MKKEYRFHINNQNQTLQMVPKCESDGKNRLAFQGGFEAR